MASREMVLEVEHLSKQFVGTRALDDVSLSVGVGQVRALVGQNGCGKSTLVKVLAGFHAPESGSEFRLCGEELDVSSPRPDQSSKMHFIHQNLGLVTSLNTVDNLAMGRGYRVDKLGRIQWKKERAAARAAIQGLGFDFDVRVPIAQLSAVEQTVVGIIRALRDWVPGPGLLVLDEATAALPAPEVTRLFEAVRRLTAQGAGVLMVTHRLDEVLEIADEVTVLREGRVVTHLSSHGLVKDRLVELMIGRPIENLVPTPPEPSEEIALVACGLRGATIEGLDLDVRKAEIVGVTGLDGSGREEFAPLLFGAVPRLAGKLTVFGTEVGSSPRASIDAGIALVPADRAKLAALGELSIRENVVVADLKKCRVGPRISKGRERAETRKWIRDLEIRPPKTETRFARLSGGNQQKVVLARWLRNEPKVFVLDEPTQGVDVGAKAAIYDVLVEAARKGAAIIVCSAEAEDLARLCDRVIVMQGGRVAAELSGSSMTLDRILFHTLAEPSPEGSSTPHGNGFTASTGAHSAGPATASGSIGTRAPRENDHTDGAQHD